MAKKPANITCTFINPNTSKEFEQQLRKIIVDKLRYKPHHLPSIKGNRRTSVAELESNTILYK